MSLDDSAETECVDFESGAFVELRKMVRTSLEGKTAREIASYYVKYKRDKSKHGIMLVEDYIKEKPYLFRFQFYIQVGLTEQSIEKAAKIRNRNSQQEPEDYSAP